MTINYPTALSANPKLKLATLKNEEKPISKIPETDSINVAQGAAAGNVGKKNTSDIKELNTFVGYLQVANKSIKDAESLTNDIKSNYYKLKDSSIDEEQKYLQDSQNKLKEIKDKLENSKLGSKNVFAMDYKGENLAFDPKILNMKDIDVKDLSSIQQLEKSLKQSQSDINSSLFTLSSRIDGASKKSLIPESLLASVLGKNFDKTLDDKKELENIKNLNKDEFKMSHSSVDPNRVHELLA